MYTCIIILYCLYFADQNFCELLFLTVSLKKIREYAVEAGDGAVSKFSLKFFTNGIKFLTHKI